MTGSMADDFAATLAAARAGHDGGFAALYEALVRPVAGYLRTRGVPEVEDATSEVFLDVFRGLARFSGDEPAFRAWVFTIAHRRAVDAHRRSARGPSTVPLDETPVRRTPDRGVARSAEDVALDGLALERVHDVLAGLTDGQRDVLLLRVVGDLTVDQVADVLGLSPGAVKALQRRGLDALRELLAAREAGRGTGGRGADGRDAVDRDAVDRGARRRADDRGVGWAGADHDADERGADERGATGAGADRAAEERDATTGHTAVAGTRAAARPFTPAGEPGPTA